MKKYLLSLLVLGVLADAEAFPLFPRAAALLPMAFLTLPPLPVFLPLPLPPPLPLPLPLPSPPSFLFFSSEAVPSLPSSPGQAARYPLLFFALLPLLLLLLLLLAPLPSRRRPPSLDLDRDIAA